MSDRTSEASLNFFGCLPLVISCLVLWALLFGVTIDGKHYGVSCSCENGVTVESGKVPLR